MHPAQFSIAPANGVDDRIDRIPDHSIDALNTGINHHFRDLIRCCLCHGGTPPYVVVFRLLFPQILRCLKSTTAWALEAPTPSPERTDAKSEVFSSLQMGSLRQPTRSTLFAQSSRRAKGPPQVRELAARPLLLGTVRPSGRRSLSLPSQTNLDRVPRRSIETDSAFHRMSQINGALLHVSGSARPESAGPQPDTRSAGDS